MSDKTPTNEQLAQWLYDAEYDWSAEYFDYEVEMPPMPSDTFPHYYSDDYHPTLAAIFRELIESRAKLAAIPKPDPDVVALAERQLAMELQRRDEVIADLAADPHSPQPALTRQTADLRVQRAEAAVAQARNGCS